MSWMKLLVVAGRAVALAFVVGPQDLLVFVPPFLR